MRLLCAVLLTFGHVPARVGPDLHDIDICRQRAGNGTAGSGGDHGPATSAQLSMASGIALDLAGNLYLADSGNHRIREVSNGVITTVAGNGTPGFSGGPAENAQLYRPRGFAVDLAGKIYVADTGNDRIRLLRPASSSCSASVTPTALSSGAAGGSITVMIKTTSASCAWAVQSLPIWITHSGSVVGSGSPSVTLVVAKILALPAVPLSQSRAFPSWLLNKKLHAQVRVRAIAGIWVIGCALEYYVLRSARGYFAPVLRA